MSRATFATAASLFALIAAGPAFAQDEAGAGEPAAAPAEDEDEIVVTAQLREQRLVEVPITLTTYTGEFLDELGLNEFEDVARFVPGFEVQNQSPNNPGFVMRGVTSDSGEAFNEPRVSVFQDGVSISKSRGSYVELFDLERIEVARGPQSTLYGRGALIGAVNIIQNRADPDASAAMFSGAFGNFASVDVEGMVNVPLSDSAALRLAGRYRNRRGFIENLLGGEDFSSVNTAALRGTVHVAPTDRISIDVFANYQEDHPNGTSFKSMSFSPTDPLTGAVLGTREPWTGATLAPHSNFEGRPLGLDRKVYGVTGIARAELSDSLSLTSITAWREFESLEIFDADGISLPALTAAEEARGEQFSQELRLTYDNDGPITAFVGLSYFTEQGSQRTPAQFDERVLLARLAGALHGGGLIPGRPVTDPAPIGLFSNTAFMAALLQGTAAAFGVPLPGPVAAGIAANLKPGHLETATNSSETDAFDIFGDVTFRVSDQFEIGLGARYSHDSKSSTIRAAVLNGRSILGGFIGALSQPAPIRTALLGALAVPGAANIPPSAMFPVPLFGLGFQPTNNNGDVFAADLDDESFTWRVNLRYEPRPDFSIYANYARGRRPDVLAAAPPAAPFGPARFTLVDAETVDSFELGARHQAGRSLLVDGALFYYRYDNFQTTEQVGTLFVVTNAGEAEAYGFEGQLRWRAHPNATIFATYAYNHSRFGTGVRDGNRFRLSPDHTLSLGGQFGVDVGPGRISFVPSVTYQSRVFFDDDNDLPALQQPPNALVADNLQDEVQDGYVLVNARLGYEVNENFSVEAFVSNLFDEEYIKDAGNTGNAAGLPTFIAGEPRLYGLQARVRF